MNIRSLQMIAFAVFGALALHAQAQETTGVGQSAAQQEAVATVQTEGGVIMLSRDNGPFTTAEPNAPVVSGERLMVTQSSIAKVVYNDGCTQTYNKAGIYKIEPGCKRAAPLFTSGEKVVSATGGQLLAAAVGGAAVGMVIAHHNCHDCKCPPISR